MIYKKILQNCISQNKNLQLFSKFLVISKKIKYTSDRITFNGMSSIQLKQIFLKPI